MSYGGPLGPRPGAKKRAAKLNKSGLGRSLVNDQQRAKKSSGHSDRHTTDTEPGWVKLQSVTQERPLDEFLSNAELADKDFTTERTANIRIIQSDGQLTDDNPYVLSKERRQDLVQRHYENAGRLTVPRRPHWSKDMSPQELDRLEKEAFLEWRRSLADLQDNQDLLLTPFERNLEVWRQLWRVVERSDLVVQIVDSRNPLLYRSVDLDAYVHEVGANKRTLLLVNKADLLSQKQREEWARYFNEHGISFAFFSAKTSLEKQEAEADHPSGSGSGSASASASSAHTDDHDDSDYDDDEELDSDFDSEEEALKSLAAEKAEAEAKAKAQEQREQQAQQDKEQDPEHEDGLTNSTRVLSVEQLEELFKEAAPDVQGRQLQIGLVGYPNVGKSSTINALIGAKKVSVSSTPGKTKHFQTIKLSEDVMLCDCPGLVFPNFAQTNGDLVCNGVLPIDQLREYIGPTELVCEQIPKHYLEAVYGIHIHTAPIEEGGTGVPTPLELLNSYARARGFMRTGGGDPDISRAARLMLKDYVNGKLLYCEPPPDYEGDFNADKFGLTTLSDQRRNQLWDAIRAAHPGENLDINDIDLAKEMEQLKFSSFDTTKGTASARSRARFQPMTAGGELDRDFFSDHDAAPTSSTPFHLQKLQAGKSKKHFKGRGKK